MKHAIKVALAFVGLLVGAGFASGQETIQYFLSYGYVGIAGTLVAGIVIVVIGTTLFQLGSYYLADDHSAVFKSVSSPLVAGFMDIATMFTLFSVGFVMIAGAGSNLEQQFGFPTWAGSVIITILLVISGFLDVDRITNVISTITPLLIVAVFGALFVTITNMPHDLSHLNELAMQNEPAAGLFNNWVLSAVNYAALNTIVGVSMILVIAGSQINPREAGVGGLIGGIIFASLLTMLAFIIFSNMDGVIGSDMPLLMVFTNIHPVVGIIVALIIYLMIYNTAVGMFYGMSRRLSANHPQRFRTIYFSVIAIGFVLSFIGFENLVSWVYPVVGYAGMALIVVMLISWARNRDAIREESNRRARLSDLAGTEIDPSEHNLTAQERAEAAELVKESNVDDRELWETVKQKVAEDLDADPESEFSLEKSESTNSTDNAGNTGSTKRES